ncbi:L-threonylcarbamoyladenylate synthase [Paenibacillus sp. PastF-1]|nr:L-threonylcarbamoyladenylate synthase [Paenibacillus sp. PastF-2]MDF9845598.1 L-threonylcarbamoyladenylate synthase [Paenibacillus sp. PastM-2]MDF9852169.1 L-threonylcarbamoyladenylate synthase [Paenibacillus sp. PastF-1]MDH6478101.1 L-threonylcarbamoyladenylate synthase [Paenibacillus sp. PastH-2]MDH6505835.1 L-threonylcarbamoyladenylate synthase [Paenibacillus sp. PastM-3]
MMSDPFSFAVQHRTQPYSETRYWRLEPAGSSTAERQYSAADQQSLAEAAAILAGGGTVAFPTETVYGLGADARNTAAVEAVFAAKGRPSDNPLIVHIARREQLGELVSDIHPAAAALMDAFWPGPLSLVLPVRPGVLSPRVTAGLDTVAVRMPDHPAALALLERSGCPVAAPSANRSGRPSPTAAAHVMEDLAGYIGGVLDDGPTGVGVESTVVQVQPDGTAVILRPGGITAEQLSAVAGAVAAPPSGEAGGAAQAGGADAGGDSSPAPRSPGMKYTHYAPQGSLSIVSGTSPQRAADTAAALLLEARGRGEKTGLLLFEEHRALYSDDAADYIVSLGPLAALEEGARILYSALRYFDEVSADYIIAEACPDSGLGSAIMNRLRKAAGGSVVRTD